MIDYVPSAIDDYLDYESLEGQNFVQVKLIDRDGDEFVYQLEMQISVCHISIESSFLGPFPYKYFTKDVPAVTVGFENEKLHPDVNSPGFITYEPSECENYVRFRCRCNK